MKKLTLILVGLITLGAITSSCKKEYVCQCHKTYTRSNGTTIREKDGLYTYNDTKTRAANRCENQEGTGSNLSGEYVRDCEIQ